MCEGASCYDRGLSILQSTTEPISMDSHDHDVIKRFINESWGSVGPDGTFPPFFPGPQPISIERQHFPVLTNSEYFVCEKTDGMRAALVCLRVGNKKFAVVVNRAMNMNLVSFSMPKSAYDGTILDGEIVKTKSGKTYMMLYDGVIVGGKSIKNLNLRDRLKSISYFVKGIMVTPKDPFTIKVKTFFGLKNMRQLIMKLKHNDFPYENDGVVFTPIEEPVKIGTHNTLFKWKPHEKNTVDFLVKNRGDGSYGLYIQERRELVFSTLVKPSQKWIDILKDDMIAECNYNSTTWPKGWELQSIRTDKTHPNNRRTLNRTMVNIQENIQLSEFLKMQK